MSEVWGSVYAMERDRATGNDPDSLRKRILDLERERDDYVVRANANVCELNQEIERLRAFVGWVESWVSNPVNSYSVVALDGLFGMTRDKIAALSNEQLEGQK